MSGSPTDRSVSSPEAAGRYRKKPIEVMAVQWTGDNDAEVAKLGKLNPGSIRRKDRPLPINTLEGVMLANVGDWIIRGVAGELYPCKPDIFAQTYEPVKAVRNANEETND